jgi:PTS system nitrogen regulatory IIA component
MIVSDLIGPDQVIAGLRGGSKGAVLRELARRAAKALKLDENLIADALLAREEMGSTGVGSGVAIPHATIAGLARPFALFAQLRKPIEFAAIDDQPVDLLCLLLSPAKAGHDHLTALACLSRRLRDATVAGSLRGARDDGTLYRLLSGP